MAYNKVFFHGIGNGIGDMMETLDAAGIPFTIKSIMNEGFIQDGIDLIKNSGVQHQLIYRDVDPGGWGDDHPNLNLPPHEAAAVHWDVVEDALPSAVKENKHLVWVEPVNEIDTHTHAEWLGQFCYEIAEIAMERGYKVLLAGFNAGQPDIGMWEEYFSKFLALCSLCPDKVGVSLHEAKFGDIDTPAWDDEYYPWTIGRFEFLMEACENMGFKAPTTFISEWAWSYNKVPSKEVMMRDVAWYSALIAQYPTVIGTCLWNLDMGVIDGDALAGLIPLVTDYTLNVIHPDPVPPDPLQGKSVKQIIWDHSKETQCISLNSDAALQDAILDDRFTPVGTEVWMNPTGINGDEWAYMAAEDLAGIEQRRVYIAPVPHWDQISYFTDPYLPEPPVEPVPPPEDRIVMPKYFFPENEEYGPIVILANNWSGGNERQQLQSDHYADMYITKNSAWEKRVWDKDYIYLVMDTSPGNGEYYTAKGPWMPRLWEVGGEFKSQPRVKFFRKDTCQLTQDYTGQNHLRLAAHYDEWDSPNGFLFYDVVEIEWVFDDLVDETYWYSAGVGLVRWRKYDGRESNVVEYHEQGQQENNKRETINCI